MIFVTCAKKSRNMWTTYVYALKKCVCSLIFKESCSYLWNDAGVMKWDCYCFMEVTFACMQNLQLICKWICNFAKPYELLIISLSTCLLLFSSMYELACLGIVSSYNDEEIWVINWRRGISWKFVCMKLKCYVLRLRQS